MKVKLQLQVSWEAEVQQNEQIVFNVELGEEIEN